MVLADLLGAVLTLLALALLGLGGYLASLWLLGARTGKDPLELAVASLLLATGEALGIGLLLGELGVLRIELALLLQGLLVLALLVLLLRRLLAAGGSSRELATTLAQPLALLARRSWAVASEHWAASLLVLHAVGSEALRGLLRPPLSWDALMYHLVLAGTWLRDENLAPVLGNIPMSYYGYVPANGSVWFWWWMAPSHSELYVNLASLPHWLLVALATGAIARRLGAARWWPLAACLVALTPTVVRFAATEYVDLFLAGTLLGGFYFGLGWMRGEEGRGQAPPLHQGGVGEELAQASSPSVFAAGGQAPPRQVSWADAVLFAAGVGLAAGAKVLGIVYGGLAVGAALLFARGDWRRRVPQLAAMALVAALLGGYFYARNVVLGADPLALPCELTASGARSGNEHTFPRRSSVIGSWQELASESRLAEAFLGTIRPASVELGLGPQALLLLPAVLAFPLLVPRHRRREAWTAALLLWGVLLFWLTVPFARDSHVYANVRYLVPCVGLAFAGLISLVERKQVRPQWISGLAVALLVQDLLQLRAELPFEARVAIGVVDLAVVVLLLSHAVRSWAIRRWAALALAAVLLAVAAAPALASFRLADRARALGNELTVHRTNARYYAEGWAWLDAHAGDGNVAMVHAPNSYLTYPTMGPRLERDARYVNINAADHPHAILYPRCQPRVDEDREAWLVNLERGDIRWLHLARFPGFSFPLEQPWADSLPDLFTLRFEDATNLVYEVKLAPFPQQAKQPAGD